MNIIDPENADRGKYLKQMVESSGINIGKLIKKIGYKDRSVYYTHINKPNLSYEILQKYSEGLNKNFYLDFPEMMPQQIEEPRVSYNKPETLEQAIEEIDIWRNKYIRLMEKHVSLMEEKLGAV